MNTLYYLAQKTEETEWNDHMGQDLTAPVKPVLNELQTNEEELTLTLQMSSEDQGSTYEYYIEATNYSTSDKITSNTAEACVLSGLQGYSIVVDQYQNTIPDLTVETTSDTCTLAVTNDFVVSETAYVHIRAIDNQGNGSETTHKSFVYRGALFDYDEQLNFLLEEFPKVEIKIAIGTTNMNLTTFKSSFTAELEERGISEDMFSIEYITYSTTDKFMSLLESSAWEEGSLRFLIHMSNNVAFFCDTSLHDEVLARTKQEKIHYIGLGSAAVQIETLRFIIENDNLGYYIYSGNLTKAVYTLLDYLVWNVTFPEGTGTESDPFILRTKGQLDSMKYVRNAYFALGQDIDMQGTLFAGVGDAENPFTGHIDGRGYRAVSFR